MTIKVIPLSEKDPDAEGLWVCRSRESKHELCTKEGFHWNDYFISDEGIVEVLKVVCGGCPVVSQCLPEYIKPKGILNTKGVKIRGAQVYTDNCRLADTFIPDQEFHS